jgi:hypothetical protein
MAPLSEWFYDKDTRFLQAFNIWKTFGKDQTISKIFIDGGLVRYGKTYRTFFEKTFNVEIIIHNIDNILTSSYKENYNFKFENIRRYSNIYNSYTTIANEISLLKDTLEDINTIDYIRIHVKGIANIPMLPVHTCEEPPPPTEEELAERARLKEQARIDRENELKNLYLEEKFNFEYEEDNTSHKMVAE